MRRFGEKCDECVQKCEKFKKILQIVKKVFAIMENMCYNEKKRIKGKAMKKEAFLKAKESLQIEQKEIANILKYLIIH